MADENLNINIDITADASEAKEAVSELKDSVNESKAELSIDIKDYAAVIEDIETIKNSFKEMYESLSEDNLSSDALSDIVLELKKIKDEDLTKILSTDAFKSIGEFTEFLEAFGGSLGDTIAKVKEFADTTSYTGFELSKESEEVSKVIELIGNYSGWLNTVSRYARDQIGLSLKDLRAYVSEEETAHKKELAALAEKKTRQEILYKETAALEKEKRANYLETAAAQLKLDSESKRAENERIAEAKANNLRAQQIYTEGKNTREEDLNAQRIATEEQKRIDSAKVASAKAAAEEQRKLYLQNKDTREKEVAERKKQLDEETKAEKDAAKAKADADKKAKEEQKEAAEALKKEQADLKQNVDNVTEAFDRADAMSTVLFSKAIDLAKEAAQEVFELTKKSIEMGEEFEYIIDKVSTLSGDIYDENAISNEVKRIAETYGKSASDVADAVYDALSSGISEQEVFGGIDAAAKLSVAGFTDVQTALEGLVSVLNAYSMSADNATDIANKFVIAQDLGRAEIGDLAKDIGSLAPTAQLAGVQVEEMLAAVAAVSATVGNSAETMTQINAALSNVIKPTEKAKKLAQELNLEFSSAAIKEKGFLGFIDDVAEKTKMNEEAIATLFGNIRGFRALASLTTEKGKEIYEQYNEALASGINKLDENFQKVSDNLAIKTDILKSKVSNVGIDIYDLLSRGLKNSVDNITVIVEGISEIFNDQSIQKAVKDLGLQLSDSFADVVKSGFDIDTVKSIVKSILEIISNIDTAFGSMFTASASIFADLLSNITSLLSELTSLDSSIGIVTASTLLLSNTAIKAANGVTSLIGAIRSSINVMTTSTVIATEKIASLVTNVGVLLASALTVVTLWGYVDTYKRELDSYYDRYENKADEYKDKITEIKSAFESATASLESHMQSVNNNANAVNTLWSELKGYVDEQGNVIENQERVNTLVSILNNDYGQTIDLQGSLISGYSELTTSVEEYIEATREQARLEYLKPAYTEAVGQIDEMRANYNSALDEMEDALRRKILYGDILKSLEGKIYFGVTEDISKARANLAAASDDYAKYIDVVTEYGETLFDFEQVIAEYEESIRESVTENKNIADDVVDIAETASSEVVDIESNTTEKLKKIQADYLKGRQRALEDAYDDEKARRDKELALLKQDNEDAYKEQERIWSNAEYVRKKAYEADLENLKNIDNKLIDERKKQLDTDYTNFKREKDDEYTLQERNAKDLVDSEIKIAEARIDSVKKYFDNKKKLEDKSYNETIKRLEAQKNAELGIIDAEAEARKRKQKEDEIAKIESELAQYGDLNKLLTSADIKAYKDLEQKLIDKRTELAEYDYEQDLKKRKENAEEKYKIEKEAEEKRHKEELERISERSTSQIDSLKAALEQNKTEWNRSLEDSKTAWKRAQEDELQALKDKNAASLEDYKATLKAQEDALKEENDALIEIFKIHLDDEKTEYKRMQQEKYDEAKEINEAYLKDLKRQNSDVIDEIKDKQSEALKLLKENADILTDPTTGFMVEMKKQANETTTALNDNVTAVTEISNALDDADIAASNLADTLQNLKVPDDISESLEDFKKDVEIQQYYDWLSKNPEKSTAAQQYAKIGESVPGIFERMFVDKYALPSDTKTDFEKKVDTLMTRTTADKYAVPAEWSKPIGESLNMSNNLLDQSNDILKTANRTLDFNLTAPSTQTSVTQNINFNAPVPTPDLVANDIRNATTYGLNSANRR